VQGIPGKVQVAAVLAVPRAGLLRKHGRGEAREQPMECLLTVLIPYEWGLVYKLRMRLLESL
jgi:hypothetical protein